jgi:hypothetical protein
VNAQRRFATLLIAFGLAACSGSSHGGSSYGSGDPSLAAPNPAGGPIDPFLTDGKAVLRAVDAVASRSGTPLRITTISADGVNGLTLDVQETERHVNVDRYVVAADGSISGPTPVKLMSLDGGPITAASVDQRAFDPKAIAFAALAQTEREAIRRSNYPDARVSQWEIDGLGPDDRRYIYLESARARPVAAVSPGLKIVRMSF